MNNIDYTNLDDRLDLDSYITNIVLGFPKNQTDFLFYIRGNIETGELCFMSASSYDNFGLTLCSLGIQSEEVFEQLNKAVDFIKEHKDNLSKNN